jgi:hypothetical protein
VVVTAGSLPVFSLSPALPENWEARTVMRDTIFAPVMEAASAAGRFVREPGSRDSVRFLTDVQEGYLYLIFYGPGDSANTPLASEGSFIIKRNLRDGKFVQAKIFLQNDSGFFVRLFPMSGRTEMDVCLFGEIFQKGVILDRPFESLLTAPFSTMMALSEGAVDWSLVLPSQRTESDRRIEHIVGVLRPVLPRLGDVDDGAMDSAGRFVFIGNEGPQPGNGGLNCSGFAKFVVDGFYKPLMGRLTDIAVLKARNLAARGNHWSPLYEESRDPYFGLDWSRNLARLLESARTGDPPPSPEFADVKDVERFPYMEDIGFPIGDIRTILYILARRDPGYIYLGSLSRQADDGAPVPQHHHLAVFFPYVDEKSAFHIVVMERNTETSVESLQGRFPRDSVHLVRIGSEGQFTPPIR